MSSLKRTAKFNKSCNKCKAWKPSTRFKIHFTKRKWQKEFPRRKLFFVHILQKINPLLSYRRCTYQINKKFQLLNLTNADFIESQLARLHFKVSQVLNGANQNYLLKLIIVISFSFWPSNQFFFLDYSCQGVLFKIMSTCFKTMGGISEGIDM